MRTDAKKFRPIFATLLNGGSQAGFAFREAAERRWMLRRAALRRSVLEYWQGETVVEDETQAPVLAIPMEKERWG